MQAPVVCDRFSYYIGFQMQKCWLLSALLVVASVKAGTITISFEAFPGPDGVLGTSDDIPAPNCGGSVISICGPLGNDFSTMGDSIYFWHSISRLAFPRHDFFEPFHLFQSA